MSKPNICLALGCNEELTPPKRLYCNNAHKQAVKYAIANGRQCKACHKEIKKPVPVLGGMANVCNRKRCIASRCE